MPVKVRKGSGAKPWKIVEVATGKVKGSSTTKAKAQASANARNAAKQGENKILLEIKEDLIEIKTCLKGYGNGDDGLISQVENNAKRITKLSNKVWFIVGISAAGGGSIGTVLTRFISG